MNEEIIRSKRGFLKRDFELFHIKDKRNLEFDLHYHDFNKIIIFLSGRVTYLIEGKSYKLKPWDIMLVSNNEIHRPIIDSSETYERIIIWVNSDFIISHNSESCDLLNCFQLASKRGFNLLRLNPELQSNIKSILNSLETAITSDEFGSKILSNALFIQFMVYLNRFYLLGDNINEDDDIQYDKTIDEILNYINNNLNGDMSIDTLAAKFYLSKYYLMHKFKSQTGYTLHNYILQKRLILANSLLNEEVSISDICTQCGFNDYSSFVRAFKKKYGASPKNYLKNNL